jgi:enoyl-CoA hydratase/carnithine racemase/3-hydroxyacyl-CoA dehydrogenase
VPATPLKEAEDGRSASGIATRHMADGVAWLTLPRGSVGIAHLPRALTEALRDTLLDVQRAAEAGKVRALVLADLPQASAGRGGVASLLEDRDAEDQVGDVLAAQAALRVLEQLPIPTLAAVDGDCIGALLELTLACSYRLASNSAAVRFSLPQVRLGLIPGLGATVRLPRLVGVEAALRFMLSGSPAGAEQAKNMGLVDGIFATARFEENVARFARDRVEHGRLHTRPSRPLPRRLLEETAPGRRLLFSRITREGDRAARTREAEAAALQSVADGLSLPLDEAFAREARLYASLVGGDRAKSLIRAALLEGEASHPHPTILNTIERVGILGAHPGAIGLAWLFARNGIDVRLKDRERASLTTASDELASRLRAARPGRAGTLEAAVGHGGFGTLQLVISSHDEPERVSAELLEAERHVTGSCLIASASPLVQVGEWANDLEDPTRAFAIVPSETPDLFPAMEIAAGPATTPDTLAAACELVRRLGGLPIHVGDHSGFLVYRLIAVALWQAAVLVQEGAGVKQIDDAAEAFGFRLGPFKRADATGRDGVRRLLMIMPAVISDVEPIPELLEWVARRTQPFYRYWKGRAGRLNPDLPVGREARATPPDTGEILERLLLATVNEAARSLDEGIVQSTADLDLAAVFGFGYPRRRGGLLFQADRTGLREIETRLESLSERLGTGFAPAPLIRALAASGENFYGAGATDPGHGPTSVIT